MLGDMLRFPQLPATLLCLAIGAALQAQVKDIYSDALVSAQRALTAGDTPAGLDALDRALRANPEGADALLLLGRVYVDLSRYDDATTAFQRAIGIAGEASPTGMEALYGLADALARQERNVEAVETLERILAIDPAHGSVHHDLGRIHLVLGRLEEAVKEFRIEIDLQKKADVRDPITLGSSYEGLGIATYRLGDDTAAIEALSRAPETTEAFYHKALALARSERYEDAARMFETVLEKDPEHRGALQNLARCKAKLGLMEDRRQALMRFQTLYREDIENNTRRLKTRDLLKKADQAAQEQRFADTVVALEEAAELAPEDVEVRMDLGRGRLQAGDRAGSIEAFQDALRIDPLHAEAHYRLGRVRVETDVSAAVGSFEHAVRLAPMQLTYHVHLAQAYMQVGRTEEAVRELRLAQRLNPDDPDGPFNLGLGLAQAGLFPEAAELLERAVELGFTDPSIHMALAQVYRALGDPDRSRQAQERYRRLTTGDRAPQ